MNNSLSFNAHSSFSLSPHFGGNVGLNRLFNAALDHSQAILGFYHKSPPSLKTTHTPEDDNVSENGSFSNGSNQDPTSQTNLNSIQNDQIENHELNHNHDNKVDHKPADSN